MSTFYEDRAKVLKTRREHWGWKGALPKYLGAGALFSVGGIPLAFDTFYVWHYTSVVFLIVFFPTLIWSWKVANDNKAHLHDYPSKAIQVSKYVLGNALVMTFLCFNLGLLVNRFFPIGETKTYTAEAKVLESYKNDRLQLRFSDGQLYEAAIKREHSESYRTAKFANVTIVHGALGLRYLVRVSPKPE